MNRNKISRVAVLALAASVLAAVALLPAFAGAKSSKGIQLKLKNDGGTTVKLDAGTAGALTQLGISAAPVKPASAGKKGVTFPITGGKVNSKTLAGSIRHSGGLSFSNGTTVVKLTRFTINIDKKPDLVASVGGARVSILSLDLAKLKNTSKGKQIRLSGIEASLTAAAATALNDAFGTTAFKKGLVLGTASVNATVK